MADPIITKITQLPDMGTAEPAADDLIATVDVSELLVENQTKKMRHDKVKIFQVSQIVDAIITEAKLAAALVAKLVTNGNSHDHYGGDGAQINHTTLSNIGSNSHGTIDSHIGASSAHGASGNIVGQNTLDTHKGSGDHDGRYFTEGESDGRFAAIGNGVSGGNSHDHNGGDGAQIPNGGIASGAIDNTKIGYKVPVAVWRQGGHAGDWNIPGTTAYGTQTVAMQFGSISVPDGSSPITVWFPTTFFGYPIVTLTMYGTGAAVHPQITSCESTFVTISFTKIGTGTLTNGRCFWVAIGPNNS